MKKLFAALIILVALTFPAAAAGAEKVQAELPDFDVAINGVKIQNKNREYPFLVYKDITYFPMTYHDCRFLGLVTEWDNGTGTLSVTKENISCGYRDYKSQSENSRVNPVTICDFAINVNGMAIDNSKEEYPLLTFRGVTYFPLTWRFAREEFGWEYGFDAENGLIINSDNQIAFEIDLPERTGAVAFDNNYYYYEVKTETDNYIYSTRRTVTHDAYILHHLPRFGMSMSGSDFINSDDGVYIGYYVGSSPIMSSKRFFKLNGSTNSVSYELPDSCGYGNHGWFWNEVRSGDISVREEHSYWGASEITYEKDGKTFEVPALSEVIQIGAYRNAVNMGVNMAENDCIKIFGDKIYFTGYNVEENIRNSDLYVIDTNTNEIKKLIDDVYAYHVYTGYSQELSAESTMILFDKDGVTMRFTEANEKTEKVADTSGLVLVNAVGNKTVYAAYNEPSTGRTVVRSFGEYACGDQKLEKVVFETKTSTRITVSDEKLAVYTVGESPDDKIRLAVYGGDVEFASCDAADSIFLKYDSLVYTSEGRAFAVWFKQNEPK